jgi:hypothetical protein
VRQLTAVEVGKSLKRWQKEKYTPSKTTEVVGALIPTIDGSMCEARNRVEVSLKPNTVDRAKKCAITELN